jgi:hypothetical protein
LETAVVVHPAGTPPYQPPPPGVTELLDKSVNDPFVTLSVPARAESEKETKIPSSNAAAEMERVVLFIGGYELEEINPSRHTPL